MKLQQNRDRARRPLCPWVLALLLVGLLGGVPATACPACGGGLPIFFQRLRVSDPDSRTKAPAEAPKADASREKAPRPPKEDSASARAPEPPPVERKPPTESQKQS